jgi:predicted AAA+ superfamily ATPase
VSGNRYDVTHNLENIVLNELIYLGYEVTVFDNRGREIGFRATKGDKLYLIQVAYSVAEEKAYDREFSAFAGIDNTAKKIIITNDDIDYSTSTVYHYKLRDFLLMDEL